MQINGATRMAVCSLLLCVGIMPAFATSETCTVVEGADSPDGRFEVVHRNLAPEDEGLNSPEAIREKRTGRIVAEMPISHNDGFHSYLWSPTGSYVACGFRATRHTDGIVLYYLSGLSRFEELDMPVVEAPDFGETTSPKWLAEGRIHCESHAVSWEGRDSLKMTKRFAPMHDDDSDVREYSVEYVLHIKRARDGAPKLEISHVKYDVDMPAKRAFREADDELNRVYKDVMKPLNGEQRNALVKAQRAWLKSRDAQCARVTTNTASSQWYDCMHDATEKRTEELKRPGRIED